MADKTTKWILELVDQITAPLKSIEQEAKLVTDTGMQMGAGFEKSVDGIGRAVKESKTDFSALEKEAAETAETLRSIDDGFEKSIDGVGRAARDSKGDFSELDKEASKTAATFKTMDNGFENSIDGVGRAARDSKGDFTELEKEAAKTDRTFEKSNITYTKLGQELQDQQQATKKAAQEFKDLGDAADRSKADLDSLGKEATTTGTQVKDLGDEVDITEKSIQDFGASFRDLFDGLQSGNLVQIGDGFKGIANNIGAMTRSALAFIATPLGATLAGLAIIGAVTADFIKYNEAARETNVIVAQMTQLEGEAIGQMRVRAKVLEEVFGQDIKDTLEIAKNNVQAFGISYEEAMDNIGDALVRGAASNDEYIDSMREYPRMFANAGFNMEEFQKIVDTGFDLGMYSDKLPDAIKEVDLALKEQTKASRDALENAFGKKFTDELFQNISNGSITTKEALRQIATETNRVGVNSQEAAQLTADLFKGAGEDAGGFIAVIDAVNGALGEQETALTGVETQLNKVLEQTEAYREAQQEALESDTYIAFAQEMELFWMKIKTWYYDAIVWAQDWFNATTKFYVQMIAAALEVPIQLKEIFLNIVEDVETLVGTFASAGDVIGNFLSGNWDEARKGFSNFKKDIKEDLANLGRDVVTAPSDIAKGVVDAYQKAGADVDAYRESVAYFAKDGSSISDIAKKNDLLTPKGKEEEKEVEKEKTAKAGGSGSGAAKSITMTLNIVQNFAVNGKQDVEDVARETVRMINDRLRDAVLTLG